MDEKKELGYLYLPMTGRNLNNPNTIPEFTIVENNLLFPFLLWKMCCNKEVDNNKTNTKEKSNRKNITWKIK